MEPIIPPNDLIPPRIYDCPDNMHAESPDTSMMATVTWPEPYATDNSGVTPKVNKTHRPLERFDVGQTFVSYRFSDLSGNSAECSFTITVTGEFYVLLNTAISCIIVARKK